MIIVIDHTIIIRTPCSIVLGISRTLLVYFERRGGLVFFLRYWRVTDYLYHSLTRGGDWKNSIGCTLDYFSRPRAAIVFVGFAWHCRTPCLSPMREGDVKNNIGCTRDYFSRPHAAIVFVGFNPFGPSIK